eukprot:8391258-Pyramimonas_sp.AAC.1
MTLIPCTMGVKILSMSMKSAKATVRWLGPAPDAILGDYGAWQVIVPQTVALQRCQTLHSS